MTAARRLPTLAPAHGTRYIFGRRGRLAPAWAGALLVLAVVSGAVQAASPLTSQEQAARVGLERVWFAHVPVDPARSRVTAWHLHADRLYAVTNSGIVAALNAETGELLWWKQVGKPGYPAFGPSANSRYLGVISGSKLYILNRHDGRAVWVRPVGSAPSSGPALSENYAYVALLTGRVEGYKLDEPDAQPWYYQSRGRTYLRPTVTGRVVSWPTAEGFLYIGRAENPGVLFRLQTAGDIVTSPAHQAPSLFVASLDGYLYSINEVNGREQWRFSTGYAITSSPAVVGNQVYVAASQPAIHTLDAATGAEQWAAPGVAHFVAQGKQRVYGADSLDNLVILDAKTGVVQARLPTSDGVATLVNDQTDRIFLVHPHGLVQCLREFGAVEPTFHQAPPAPPAEAPRDEPVASPFVEEDAAPADDAPPEDNPFAGDDGPLADDDAALDEPAAEEVAAPADELPAEAPLDDENPFD